ncbi:uncharacterized protein MYCGRDRAFT_104217 [Zymoseptoria tritici IPO323]|uniref:Uncharacterized protein n=1 Tax=Zymoseptoria tritici (strain CBS 115943 / IPO323) TaxID=336722 RepID=F9X952_ZYMTI|nr:uncharacterized protein MYCGRDRAFT_104217 [Zymoseptoria tritici IPO323]EGP88333.1 hypothetical protein MYCGRDRAFT_104217 [Zymoseptoria tritici IPO323]
MYPRRSSFSVTAVDGDDVSSLYSDSCFDFCPDPDPALVLCGPDFDSDCDCGCVPVGSLCETVHVVMPRRSRGPSS